MYRRQQTVILEQAHNNVEQGGIINAAREFTIKASAKAFSILSSGIYQDKISSIIRELCSNAFDAHSMSGKAAEPFYVQLPTQLDPQFSVKDDGLGMSEEDIYDIYSTYFSSTKTNTNVAQGMFGIGSKTPFCYVDGFTVISRHGGTKKTYMVYLSEDSVPSVVKVGEEAYEGDNGLEVYMPVKESDIYSFKTKFAVSMEFFEPKPVTNVEVAYKKTKYILKGDGWAVKEGTNYSNTARIIQGNVAYPIPYEGGVENVLDLFVPIGTVEPAASREAIQMTARTKENIAKIHTAAKADFFEKSKEGLNAVENLREAVRVIQKEYATSPILQSLDLNKYYGKYTNFELSDETIAFKQNDFKNVSINVFSSGYKNGSHAYVYNPLAPADTKFRFLEKYYASTYQFYIDDLPSSTRFIKRMMSNRSSGYNYVILEGTDSAKLLAKFGITAFSYTSELKAHYPDPKRDYTYTKKKTKVYVNGSMEETDQKPEGDFIYVTMRYNKTTDISNYEFNQIHSWHSQIFGGTLKVYALPNPDPKGIKLADYFKRKVEAISQKAVSDAFSTKGMTYNHSQAVTVLHAWAKNKNISVPSRRLFAAVCRTKDTTRRTAIREAIRKFAPVDESTYTANNSLTTVFQKFPLIEPFYNYELSRNDEKFLEYILLKDKA
jgi:hypothetical protein